MNLNHKSFLNTRVGLERKGGDPARVESAVIEKWRDFCERCKNGMEIVQRVIADLAVPGNPIFISEAIDHRAEAAARALLLDLDRDIKAFYNIQPTSPRAKSYYGTRSNL